MPTEFLGDRGLVINDESDTFGYVRETQWRGLSAFEIPQSGAVADWVGKKTPYAKIQDSIYVNLDQIASTPEAGSPAGRSSTGLDPLPTVPPGSVVLKESNRLTVIEKSSITQADPRIAPAAMVDIERAVAVTYIPPATIPSGTFCVLVNIKAM